MQRVMYRCDIRGCSGWADYFVYLAAGSRVDLCRLHIELAHGDVRVEARDT